jgi:hypothetical protein
MDVLTQEERHELWCVFTSRVIFNSRDPRHPHRNLQREIPQAILEINKEENTLTGDNGRIEGFVAAVAVTCIGSRW